MSDHHADFTSQPIEGFARIAQERGESGHFRVPLISHVEGNLWQGGCINGVHLPEDFAFVLSLYPWEQYTICGRTTRLEVKLYDAAEIPDEEQLHLLAAIVNTARDHAGERKVLVHCQAGLNRSGLLAGLSLIKRGMAPADAVALLREKRCDMVLCSQAFEGWLLDRVENCACGSYCTDGVCTAEELGEAA